MLQSKLYCIKDLVSGLRITGFLEMPNDGVAMQSFKNFLSDKPENDRRLFQLFEVAVVVGDFKLDASTVLVCDGSDVDKHLESFIKYVTESPEVC